MSQNSPIPPPEKGVAIVRRGVQSVLPNAAWDGIRASFQLAGGAAMLTTALAWLQHYLEAISLNYKLIGGTFLCSLMFITLAFVIGRVQRKQPETQTVSIPPQEQVAHEQRSKINAPQKRY
jgi:hypothetical protein